MRIFLVTAVFFIFFFFTDATLFLVADDYGYVTRGITENAIDKLALYQSQSGAVPSDDSERLSLF